MPELPEVETVARGLAKHLPGRKIIRAQVLRRLSVGYPNPESFTTALKGRLIIAVGRRGKYLLFQLGDGAILCIHLGMSGRLLLVDPKSKPGSHVRARFFLDDGRELRFEDMRVFGRIWYLASSRQIDEIIPGLAQIGVEPFQSLSGKYLQKALEKRAQCIKAVLLDQRVIAGLGNIYADESLFLAGIHPQRSARDLSVIELTILTRQIKKVLRQAIQYGGTTLRNYTDSSGINGNYQHQALVYGRTGKPCRNCRTAILMVRLGGRSSHYCPNCQPASMPPKASPRK